MGLGFQVGDRVGIWSPNHAEWVLTPLATARIGVILVCINPAHRTHEVHYALEQSGCRGLVAATTFKTSDYVQMVGEVRSDLTALEHVIFLGTEDWQGLDRICIPVPFYHCFGMVMGNLAALSHGATMVIPAPRRAIAYGMTETSPVSTQTHIEDPLEKKVGSVGRVHLHVEIRIVDPETGEGVPRGEAGELCTRGYSVMTGYWEAPERTASAIDSERWMHTGDLATMDEHGYVNIVGRIKDMVIRGGENVYPREIEEFLHARPRIRDVQVVGVPDRKYGEELMAWVQTEDCGDLDIEEIRSFCQGRIAHFKVPRYVATTDTFPMTVTGKIRKVELREMAIEQLGLHHEVGKTA